MPLGDVVIFLILKITLTMEKSVLVQPHVKKHKRSHVGMHGNTCHNSSPLLNAKLLVDEMGVVVKVLRRR